jgi:hypothetical protein
MESASELMLDEMEARRGEAKIKHGKRRKIAERTDRAKARAI